MKNLVSQRKFHFYFYKVLFNLAQSLKKSERFGMESDFNTQNKLVVSGNAVDGATQPRLATSTFSSSIHVLLFFLHPRLHLSMERLLLC
jgi:hypothetical protein